MDALCQCLGNVFETQKGAIILQRVNGMLKVGYANTRNLSYCNVFSVSAKYLSLFLDISHLETKQTSCTEMPLKS